MFLVPSPFFCPLSSFYPHQTGTGGWLMLGAALKNFSLANQKELLWGPRGKKNSPTPVPPPPQPPPLCQFCQSSLCSKSTPGPWDINITVLLGHACNVGLVATRGGITCACCYKMKIRVFLSQRQKKDPWHHNLSLKMTILWCCNCPLLIK
jgi:hypothetical protein